jgi:hypothetical protein
LTSVATTHDNLCAFTIAHPSSFLRFALFASGVCKEDPDNNNITALQRLLSTWNVLCPQQLCAFRLSQPLKLLLASTFTLGRLSQQLKLFPASTFTLDRDRE